MSNLAQRPVLKDVTLVAVTSVAVKTTIAALHASIEQADFADVLLLTDQQVPRDELISWRRIDRLASRQDYSRFMLRELGKFISTSHALCVQWDGFVLNGRAWDPAFLDYDYIGAVWPHVDGPCNVGNGGFSLRSRRLIEACKDLRSDESVAEDVVIARLCRSELERRGLRFAPEAIARRFSFERTAPTGREFGFHGAFNLAGMVSENKAIELFRGLEPGLLTRKEHLEILRSAAASGRWKLAGRMMMRIAQARSG